MGVSRIVMYVMAVGFVIGGIDKLLGNRFGLGTKFEEAVSFFPTYTYTMAGLLCLAPFWAVLINLLFDHVGSLGGIDPSFIGGVLGIGTGGYGIAVNIARNDLIGQYSGILVGSMLGATLMFTLPVGYATILDDDRKYFAKGLILGLIPIPVGCFAGGSIMGISAGQLLVNEIPLIIFSILLILGLIFIQEKVSAIFLAVSRFIRFMAMVGLILAGFTYISGITIIPAMDDLMTSLKTCAGMCIVMAGSMVMMEIFMHFFRNSLEKLGSRAGLNADTISGMLLGSISSVPSILLIKNMTPKGKVANTAFLVSITCIIGGQLSYTATQAPQYIAAMMAGKTLSAVIALILALIFG